MSSWPPGRLLHSGVRLEEVPGGWAFVSDDGEITGLFSNAGHAKGWIYPSRADAVAAVDVIAIGVDADGTVWDEFGLRRARARSEKT
jgi:hypothetical protein